jgi:tRNA-Thr(GGU) m(6)t(6)A37 methyltransferase TsaA
MFTSRPIGHVRSPYTETSKIPKGLGARHDADGELEILPEFEPGLTDIEGFSHIFVLWEFDRSEGYQLFGPTPADGRPHGVFATRSPRRPNPIGLTVLELLGRTGNRLQVRGVDMLDGTPILDLKPYMSSIPAENLRRGWLAEAEAKRRDGEGTTEAKAQPHHTVDELLSASDYAIERSPSEREWLNSPRVGRELL